MMMLEKDDIQGLVFSGYGKNPSACYLFLEIVDPKRARSWLGTLLHMVTHGEHREYADTMNIAWSARGLSALGLPDSVLGTFPREFREGLSGEEHRSRILGDTGESDPSLWYWGGKHRSPVHLMLMLFAPHDGVLERCLAARRAEYDGVLREVFFRDTSILDERREHFGFVDGISQPIIEGSGRVRPGSQPIKAGEFILGYENEYGKIPTSPVVWTDGGDGAGSTISAGRLLSPLRGNTPNGTWDLGRNGTYLVVRQLEQDVAGFWTAMEECSRQPSGTTDRNEAIRIASKCVGRWPSGAPLVKTPNRDDAQYANNNDFTFMESDPHGLACPIGAHIRRTNPRDSLEPSPAESLRAVNRHRLLRRGRSYGPRLPPFAHDTGAVERGLLFISIQANIRRQFEFVQQTWSNNPKFAGLYEDRDPLIGDQPEGGGTFTIPETPVRQKLTSLTRFVRVRGGEYFFMPSLRALRFLSELEPKS